jgi:hypothetical protein
MIIDIYSNMCVIFDIYNVSFAAKRYRTMMMITYIPIREALKLIEICLVSHGKLSAVSSLMFDPNN